MHIMICVCVCVCVCLTNLHGIVMYFQNLSSEKTYYELTDLNEFVFP